MADLINLRNLDKNTKVSRSDILEFENLLKKSDSVSYGDTKECPLKHSFCDGFYVREIFLPKDYFIVGKIHKHAHPNFMLKGRVLIATEDGVEELVAPQSIISKAGTKRALYVIEDTVWVTVHQNLTNTQDLEKLEEEIIVKDYESYDLYIEKLKQHTKNIK